MFSGPEKEEEEENESEEERESGSEDSSLIDELPSKEEQIKAFFYLHSQSEKREGDDWYLISSLWWKHWKQFTGYKEPRNRLDFYHYHNLNTPPKQIDNSSFLTLQGDVSEYVRDRHLLHEKQWKLLHLWFSFSFQEREKKREEKKISSSSYIYKRKDTQFPLSSLSFFSKNKDDFRYGGGPEISRKVIQDGPGLLEVEVRPLKFCLVRSSNFSEAFQTLSKKDRIIDIRNKVVQVFGIKENDFRLWNYFGDVCRKLLTQMEREISQSGLVDRQKIMIEERNFEGNFTFRREETNEYGYSPWGGGKEPTPPGLCGLRNMGNTCFLNSAIQSLSQTTPLRDYILSKTFEQEINPTNPLGTNGTLPIQISQLFELLWGEQYSAFAPREFKHFLSKFAPRYCGFQFHDCYEFLLYLLNEIHEDLNRVKARVAPFVSEKAFMKNDEPPEEILAKEAWQKHLMNNDSVIVDLFHGQLKSTWKCSKCKLTTTSFDATPSLSLPIPISKTRLIRLVLVWKDPSFIPLTISADVPIGGKICDLKEILIGIPKDPMFVAKVEENRFTYEFSEEESLTEISNDDDIFVFELEGRTSQNKNKKKEEEEEEMKEEDFEPEDDLLHIRVFQWRTDQNQLFSVPTICSISKSVNYKQLEKKMVHAIQRRLFLQTQKLIPYFTEGKEDTIDYSSPLFKMILTNPQISQKRETLYDLGDDYPVLLSHSKEGKNICLILEWKPQVLRSVYDLSTDDPRDYRDSSFYSQRPTSDLESCLSMLATQEKDCEFFCCHCNQKVSGAKVVEFYHCPELLIFHFDRMPTKSRYDKNDSFVTFPIHELDMSNHTIRNPSGQKLLYDLYAVVTHLGKHQTGHFRVSAKSSIDGKWYNFDDSRVLPCEESRIVSRDAYILFYQRKKINP